MLKVPGTPQAEQPKVDPIFVQMAQAMEPQIDLPPIKPSGIYGRDAYGKMNKWLREEERRLKQDSPDKFGPPQFPFSRKAG